MAEITPGGDCFNGGKLTGLRPFPTVSQVSLYFQKFFLEIILFIDRSSRKAYKKNYYTQTAIITINMGYRKAAVGLLNF